MIGRLWGLELLGGAMGQGPAFDAHRITTATGLGWDLTGRLGELWRGWCRDTRKWRLEIIIGFLLLRWLGLLLGLVGVIATTRANGAE